MSALRLFLFGPPRLELEGVPVEIQRRKVLALLSYLAVTGQPHSRDALATLFYPELDQSRARAYLRRDLAVLNTSLASEWLIADRETAELKSGYWLDVAHFRQLLAASQSHPHTSQTVCTDCLARLTEAANLYTNDFLAGFSLRDSAQFDDWQFFQAESLRQELAWVLESLAAGLTVQGEYETAIPSARRWVALDPLHEPAQRQLMQLYGQAGQPAAAIRQYEEYVALLEAELGLPPEEETTTLYEAIKARRILQPFLKAKQLAPAAPAKTEPGLAGGPALSPVAAARTEPKHNLPAQPTSFIGRATELAQIKQLLAVESGCRLLTLLGPGGIGKTRLALAAAGQSLNAYPEGAYFVSLASVSEAEFIVSAISQALGFTFSGNAEPKNQLLNYLHEKKLLLVVDNFEHLLNGADLLADILNAAPQVTLLVTSRERLNLQEEWSYEVWGMAFPQPNQLEPGIALTKLEQYSAVQLFIQRARQVKAGFNPTADDIPALLRICELVEGMPLALELAAPWLRLMTCREIAAEIQRSIDFLVTSMQNVSERHRSLRAVFEQTWARLLPEEQTVLSKLSIFQGGCGREAAAAVTGATLPLLLSLVDKALLRRTSAGRYELHELIRQFAASQLQLEPEEHQQALNRHYVYYAYFLQQRTAALKDGPQQETLAEIAADIDNVRAAWARAVALKDVAALGQAAECLCLYSEMRGALTEGEAAFGQAAAALAVVEQADPANTLEHRRLQGFLLVGQGMLRAHRGELQPGQALLEQGLSLMNRANEAQRAFGLLWLGWTLFLQGKNAEAEQIVQESLALYSNIGDRWGVAKNLFVLGNSLTARGLLAESESPLRQSLKICQEIGDRRSRLLVNRNLAILTLWFGDYDQTAQLLSEAASLSQEFNDQIGLAYTLRELGKLELARGEYTQAIQTFQKSMAITDEIGSQWESAATLDDLGVAWRLTGDDAAAGWALRQCLDAARAISNRYYTARCLGNLGSVAYSKQEYRQAEEYLQQALALWAAMGHEPYRAWVLNQLGYVLLAAGNQRQAEAQQSFAQALHLAVRHKLAPFALDAFAGVARLLAGKGDRRGAAQLLALAEQHPASPYETREKARCLLAQLAGEMPADVPAATQAANWQTMAEQVIEMLAASPARISP